MADGEARMYGEPHVVWAGNTPAGPAAFVIQRTADNPVVVEPDGHRLFAVCSFIHTTSTGLRIMTWTQMHDGGTDGVPQAALLGTEYDVLVVVDFGEPVYYSPDLSYTPDGRVARDFQPLPFVGGAAVQRVPAQRAKVTIAIGRRPLGWRDTIHLTNGTEILFGNGKDQRQPQLVTHVLAGAERVWGGDPVKVIGDKRDQFEPALKGYVDEVGHHTVGNHPLLTIYGATPDGRRLLLNTIQYDDDPVRHLLMLAPPDGRFTVVEVAFVPLGSGEPVRLRLPDGQGTLLAAEGAALRYRVAGGSWLDAGRDAALVPASAIEAEVLRGGVPQVIAL
jgi:hypothetical protein